MKRSSKSSGSSASGQRETVGDQLRQHMVKNHVLKQSKKTERASQRQKLFNLRPEDMNPAKGPTFLERKSVTLARERSYHSAWLKLRRAFPQDNLYVLLIEELDRRATAHVNVMFAEGHDLADVHTLVAAIKFMRPDVKKTSDLTRTTRASRGFVKLAPSLGRVPMPYPCLARVVQFLLEVDRVMEALWVLLTWAVCSRPGETLKLLWKHLIPPSRLQPKWMVILSSLDAHGNAQPSKVGEKDEAVVIDQPYLGWLGPALMKHRPGKAPNVAIFQFDMEHGSTWFRKALTALKYADAGLNSCYQIRHGSASTDQLQNLRSLADTMKRGRWETMKSVRRYVNGGRVAEVFEALTNRQQQEAIQAEKRIPSMLSRSPRAALTVSAR